MGRHTAGILCIHQLKACGASQPCQGGEGSEIWGKLVGRLLTSSARRGSLPRRGEARRGEARRGEARRGPRPVQAMPDLSTQERTGQTRPRRPRGPGRPGRLDRLARPPCQGQRLTWVECPPSGPHALLSLPQGLRSENQSPQIVRPARMVHPLGFPCCFHTCTLRIQ